MYVYSDHHDECHECQKQDNQLREARYWLRAICDQLFGLENFKEEDLFHRLEEMAFVLDIPLPDRDLAVVRKERTVDFNKLLHEWKEVNNEYLKNLHTGS